MAALFDFGVCTWLTALVMEAAAAAAAAALAI